MAKEGMGVFYQKGSNKQTIRRPLGEDQRQPLLHKYY